MTDWVVACAATAVAFLIADGLWLGVTMKSYHMDRLAPIKRDPMKKLPAGIFYLCYTAGSFDDYVSVLFKQTDNFL